MDEVSTVTVYAFRVRDDEPEGFAIAPFKATRRAIVEEHGGDLLEGTAEEIDAELLDEQGRYRRVATGWGVLD